LQVTVDASMKTSLLISDPVMSLKECSPWKQEGPVILGIPMNVSGVLQGHLCIQHVYPISASAWKEAEIWFLPKLGKSRI
jgi:hypothetical protein